MVAVIKHTGARQDQQANSDLTSKWSTPSLLILKPSLEEASNSEAFYNVAVWTVLVSMMQLTQKVADPPTDAEIRCLTISGMSLTRSTMQIAAVVQAKHMHGHRKVISLINEYRYHVTR